MKYICSLFCLGILVIYIFSLLPNEMIDTCMQHVIYFSAADKDIRESLHESFNLTPVLVDIIKHTCSSAVNSLCMEVRGTDAYIAHLSINACMCTLGLYDLVYILKFI